MNLTTFRLRLIVVATESMSTMPVIPITTTTSLPVDAAAVADSPASRPSKNHVAGLFEILYFLEGFCMQNKKRLPSAAAAGMKHA